MKAYLNGPSFKAAIYLFYVVILVISGINVANPDFIGPIFNDYLQSVQYGILILIAADAFLGQVFKDTKT